MSKIVLRRHLIMEGLKINRTSCIIQYKYSADPYIVGGVVTKCKDE
jgi:hypothetical protein